MPKYKKLEDYMSDNVYKVIPERVMKMLLEYRDKGLIHSDYLKYAICNDFVKVVGYSDNQMKRCLKEFAMFLYNEMPAPCWGSKEKMEKWINLHKKRRQKENATQNN